MKKQIKKIFKEHSAYILVFTFIEIIIALIAILAFVYEERLTALPLDDVRKLLETLYSQTWWGLILLSLGLSGIFSLTAIVYKKLDYYFISICIWLLLLILALNLNEKFAGIIKTAMLFVPIIIIKIICYRNEKEKISTKKLRLKKS